MSCSSSSLSHKGTLQQILTHLFYFIALFCIKNRTAFPSPSITYTCTKKIMDVLFKCSFSVLSTSWIMWTVLCYIVMKIPNCGIILYMAGCISWATLHSIYSATACNNNKCYEFYSPNIHTGKYNQNGCKLFCIWIYYTASGRSCYLAITVPGREARFMQILRAH